MQAITMLLLLSAFADAKDEKKVTPAAQVTVTASLVCMHCDFGEGEGCAAALKIDDKTPILLEGKASKEFYKMRFDGKVLVASGVLSINKDKRLVLTSDSAHLLGDADKGKAPAQGQIRVIGAPVCGRCELALCDECTLAILNATTPIVLDGELASQHAEEGKASKQASVVGKPYIDKRGLLRLNAKDVKLEKK